MQRTKRRPRARQTLVRQTQPHRADLGDGGEKMQQGLAKLTLTIMEVIRQTLERQALRRVESGTMTEEEIERLGQAFMQLKQKMTEMSGTFGMKPGELTATLGGLLKTGNRALDGVSLVDILDRLLDDGVVIAGQVKISVSDVDLIGLDLLAMLYPIYGQRRWLDDRTVSVPG